MQKLLLSFAVVFVGSIAVAATIFLKQASVNPTQAQSGQVTVASCRTGFNRPLLFGVSGDGSPSAYESGLKNAGSTLATVSINWDSETIQKNGPQDYNPESVNFPIRKAVESGLVVVVNVSGTPNWASDNPGLPPHKAQPDRANETVVREFRELVTQAVRDNKDKVKYWTYWNEPNGCMSSKGDCGYTGDSLEEFAYWHRQFYLHVKAEDPTAKVIFGNLDFTGNHSSFIRDVHNLDYDIEYDYLGLNVYNKSRNATFPIDWARAGYDAQPSNYKKPVWINEWGFDTLWWGCPSGDAGDACQDQARRDVVGLIDDAFNKFYANDWIYAAQYHNLRDRDGDYGLWSSSGPRPGGTKFLEIVRSKCDPQFGQGGTTPTTNPPPNKPIANGEIPITIRTHYTATAVNNQFPKIAVYLNNAANYDGPYDYSPCDGSYSGPAGNNMCGQRPRFEDKRVDMFDAAGSGFRDMTINASKLVPNLTTGVGNTKISYAFYNDQTSNGQDRNFNVTKIEVFGPALDNSNQSKLLLSFSADTADSYHGGYDSTHPSGQLNSFYFDMGFIEEDGTVNSNNNGMVKGFDKQELRTIKQVDSRKAGAWQLHQEGTFNFVSQEIQKVIRTLYNLNTTNAACVVASHDIGGDLLQRGEPITLTSVATVPIKKFRYSFYNRDNLVNGIPKAFCVAGAPKQPNDGCPTGSGQLVVESDQASNIEGVVQAAAWLKLSNGQVLESIWRGDIGWNRPIPLDANFGGVNGTAWNFSGYLGIERFNTFRSTAEIDALDFYSTSNTNGAMEIWRNNKGYRTTFKFNAAGNYPDWSTSKQTEIADLNKNATALPGKGLIRASGSFVANNKLWQIIGRSTPSGGDKWMRSVPITNGLPDFSKATAYTKVGSLYDGVGFTKNIAINYIVMPNGKVQEQVWTGQKMQRRFLTMTNNGPDFSSAQFDSGTDVNSVSRRSELTNSVLLHYDQFYKTDTLTRKIPQNIQVNATFVTNDDTTIGNDGKCVVGFAFAKSIDGDVDGNCVNDIYDYNVLMQHYNSDNCAYNIAGTNGCKIDMADVNFLKEKWGQRCQ